MQFYCPKQPSNAVARTGLVFLFVRLTRCCLVLPYARVPPVSVELLGWPSISEALSCSRWQARSMTGFNRERLAQMTSSDGHPARDAKIACCWSHEMGADAKARASADVGVGVGVCVPVGRILLMLLKKLASCRELSPCGLCFKPGVFLQTRHMFPHCRQPLITGRTLSGTVCVGCIQTFKPCSSTVSVTESC